MQNEIDKNQAHAKEPKNLEILGQHIYNFGDAKTKTEIEKLIKDFGFLLTDFSATRFQPVNLFRFDRQNLVDDGTKNCSETVENIKTKIVIKDIT